MHDFGILGRFLKESIGGSLFTLSLNVTYVLPADPSLVTGVFCAIAGLIFIVESINQDNGDHFSKPHSWVGFTTLCMTVIAACVGTASHVQYDASRSATPVWPDKAHWWIARLTVLLSFASIILGLNLFGADVSLQAGFALLPIFALFIHFFVDVYRWYHAKKNKEDFYRPYKPNVLLQGKDDD